MHRRPNQQNIELARSEFEHVSNQLRRKQKIVPMYKIKQQIKEIQENRTTDADADVHKKKSIFELEEERIAKKKLL
jgi:hypothetical protein